MKLESVANTRDLIIPKVPHHNPIFILDRIENSLMIKADILVYVVTDS